MIIEGIFSVIFDLLKFLFNLIPSMSSLTLPDDISSLLTGIIQASGYFLPLKDFAMMFAAFLLVTNFRFFSNIFHRIWDMIPLT